MSRFFNAGFAQTIDELPQDARLSGADQVDAWIDDDTLTLTDNGSGIAASESLLAFGRSDWLGHIAKNEDPAGMGVYGRAQRSCLIASRTKYGDGWRVEVDAEHISGRKAVRVERCDVPTQGTAVRLSLDPETEPPATVRRSTATRSSARTSSPRRSTPRSGAACASG